MRSPCKGIAGQVINPNLSTGRYVIVCRDADANATELLGNFAMGKNNADEGTPLQVWAIPAEWETQQNGSKIAKREVRVNWNKNR
jgi:hypothetical protein